MSGLSPAPSMAGPAPVLELRSVSKRFGRGAPVVDGVDLTARTGEVHAVVGESGSGKTTLLRLVAGLEVPDAGVIRLAGRAVAGAGAWLPPERRGVGMVFQDFALFPHFTTLDNVGYGLARLGRRERRARSRELLGLVGLAGFEDRYPHQLSGGQQQRVALARALATEPHLLLLDEPFSNLDTALKRSLRDEVAEVLRATETTALLVVHDAEDVLDLADRVTVLRHGAVLQAGAPEDLYRRPDDAYVARFFGDVNIVDCVAASGGVETPFGFVACSISAPTGRPVRASIRPGDLRVTPDGPGHPAIVRRVRRHGSGRRVKLQVQADGPAVPLMVHVDGRGPDQLTEGDRVYVSADVVRVLSDRE